MGDFSKTGTIAEVVRRSFMRPPASFEIVRNHVVLVWNPALSPQS